MEKISNSCPSDDACEDVVRSERTYIPDDVTAATVVSGRIVGLYRDPGLEEYMRLHAEEVASRVAAMAEEEA